MKKINWKVRFRNWSWVAAFLSQIMLIIEMVLTGLHAFGITEIQLTEEIKNWILTLANSIFVLFSILGIVQDPTTKGYGDSDRALNYVNPK